MDIRVVIKIANIINHNMKKILLFMSLFVYTALNGQNNQLHLIPQPVKFEQGAGNYKLVQKSIVGYNHADAQKLAGMLVSKLNVPTGFGFSSKFSQNAAIQLNLSTLPDQQLGDEGYTLESNKKGVVVSANKPAGLYYGIQTLLQLLPKEIEGKQQVHAKWEIPFVKITDYPRFAWRGIMLDVSRHFFSKEDVKMYIDQISRLKYNTLHWHLTDDQGWRIEIKSLPKLTEVGAWRVKRHGQFGQRENAKPGEPATEGGFYTHDDIREIIAYAQERFVTILPEIDVPGHSMAAIASYPELCCTKDTSIKVNPGSNFADWFGGGKFKMHIDNSLNPSDEKVYEFLDKVFTEVAELFPHPYIHVGGDECYKGFWEANAGCQALMKKMGYTNVEQLQDYFMGRVEKIVRAKGKKMIGWDEIFEGELSMETAIMNWRNPKYGKEAANKGHKVVMSPTVHAYLDYAQGEPTIEPPIYANLRAIKSYSFEPVPDGVDPKLILGGQGNLWTEQIPNLRHAQYMTYPRAWALSEVFWTPRELKNWDNFCQRMEKHFERADIAGINYSKAVYDPIIQTRKNDGSLILVMSTEIAGLDIHYTIDGSMPDSFSPKYTQEVVLPPGPITLRVKAYRNGKPVSHLITLKRELLEQRGMGN
jgi:hexosaminidase